MSRFVFFEAPPRTVPPALAACRVDLAALQMQWALIKLIRKHNFNPAQPRVPAGSPQGGQWTDAGGWTWAAANDRSEGGITTDTMVKPREASRRGHVPADAVQLQSGDGMAFNAPSNANFQEVYEYGQKLTDLPFDRKIKAINVAIGQGGIFDFQRQNGKFIKAYTPAANYAVGVLMNGAGASWFDTVMAGTAYGLSKSRPRYDPERSAWWYRGYMDAKYRHLAAKPGR